MLAPAGLPAGSPATQSPEQGAPTRLPDFIVTAAPDGLPWEHGECDGIEILTLCSAELTNTYVAALQRGRHLVPAPFLGERSQPMVALLFDLNRTGKAPAPPAVAIKSGSPRLGHGWRGAAGRITQAEDDTLVSASGFDRTTEWTDIDPFWLAHSFAATTPPPARWLGEGLFGDYGFFQELGRYPHEDKLRLASLFWRSEAQTAALKRKDTPDPVLLPWADFFNQPPPDRAAAAEDWSLWQAQAVLFARWALLADKTPAVAAPEFWQFAYAARRRQVTEDDFRRVFHRDYATATKDILAYLRVAVRAPEDFNVPGLHRVAARQTLHLRPATEVEIARLKGNFERMEANRLRADFPELAAQYETAARRTLKRGLRLGGDDPQVRAVLGLLEYDAGHPAEARPHLEAAFAAQAAGTRGLLALARLRLADMRIGLPSEGKLPAEALDRVLPPLFAARERRPASADVYLAIADIWAQSQTTPTQGHLAVLREGATLFPDHVDLLWHAAKLHQQHGYDAEALALAAQGEKATRDPAQRAKFTALLSPQ
ncbi:MAG: hypothetical protein HYV95_16070 [Opitutae bacterium]|nr:hypothetical protein [Opitutae bacterium]